MKLPQSDQHQAFSGEDDGPLVIGDSVIMDKLPQVLKLIKDTAPAFHGSGDYNLTSTDRRVRAEGTLLQYSLQLLALLRD